MNRKTNALAVFALCAVLATSLTASATQKPQLEFAKWEYVDTTPIPTQKPTLHAKKTIPKTYKTTAFNILISTESNGKHFGAPGSVAGKHAPSKSPKGAIGIAQVMPKTAQYIAQRRNIKWDAHKYKHDPAYNRQLGFLYFEYLFESFKGDLNKTYAAYNAGPTRLRQTIKQHGDQWLSHMPSETRAYVRKNMGKFSKIYSGARA